MWGYVWQFFHGLENTILCTLAGSCFSGRCCHPPLVVLLVRCQQHWIPYLGHINRKRKRKCQATAQTETQLADAFSKKNNSCPAALTFWIISWGTHFPGFEKLPVVAFTFANFVQERRIQNCFPVYLSQVWTPFMNCFVPSEMVVFVVVFEHSC